MISLKRSDENPILVPDVTHPWEADLAYNGCPVIDGSTTHFVYRALSAPTQVKGTYMQISSIGYASSRDGVHFKNRRQLIAPEFAWEEFGCEDPRVTKIGGKFYIFYTALSTYPFTPDGIRVGVAITKDWKTFEKHPVTNFNSKAMTLFPEKINGKYVAILSADTDRPPTKMALAHFDREEDMWSPEYWTRWYKEVDKNALHLVQSPYDHIEVGAPPIKTKYGWLFIYSYIQNYFSPPAVFTIEAVLLDLNDPSKVIARTDYPLLVPEAEYEKYGKVPNIVWPEGATVKNGKLRVYYGAADTTCALAECSLEKLLKEMMKTKYEVIRLERAPKNPIIEPKPENAFEARATFNPAALAADGKIHILYRAMSMDNTSTVGYAASKDGFTISERLAEPIYVPREPFEGKNVPNGNSGCEDPRVTQIGDRIYMCYTAYNGTEPPRVALTSIALKDFLAKKWDWKKPVLISPPGMDDKDAAIFPRKINGKYAIFHRLEGNIWLDYSDTLDFDGTKFIKGSAIMKPRAGVRDSQKIGIAGPPIETDKGWLLLYHGVSKKPDHHYHLRAALLDINDPAKVIVRTKETIFEPEMPWERIGEVNNVVFPCGAAVVDGRLFVYYGGADKVTGVASIELKVLLKKLVAESKG